MNTDNFSIAIFVVLVADYLFSFWTDESQIFFLDLIEKVAERNAPLKVKNDSLGKHFRPTVLLSKPDRRRLHRLLRENAVRVEIRK